MDSAERARRFRMARTELNRNGNETMAMVNSATGIAPSTVCNLENPDCDRQPNISVVSRLAEHYGVNAAWLTGQTESWTLNEDSQAITEMIGLSPKAIENLRIMMKDEDTRRLVNSLIESSEFRRWVSTLSMIVDRGLDEPEGDYQVAGYVDYAAAIRDYTGDKQTIPFSFSEGDYRDLMRWKASREMDRLVNKVTKRK